MFVSPSYEVVFFDENGKVLSSQEVLRGESAVAPEIYSHDLFLFKGWDRSFDNVTAYLEIRPLPVEENCIVLALHDGSGAVRVVEWDKSKEFPSLNKNGYKVEGWYLDASLTEKADVNALTESVALYAKWVKTYTVAVVFENGGSFVDFVREGGSYEIKAKDGEVIGSVIVNGEALSAGADGKYVIGAVSSDCRVIVTLKEGAAGGCVGGINSFLFLSVLIAAAGVLLAKSAIGN